MKRLKLIAVALTFAAIATAGTPDQVSATPTVHRSIGAGPTQDGQRGVLRSRTCGLLPGEGAYSYITTVGVRCRIGARVANHARKKFCRRHNECQSQSVSASFHGKVRRNGWRCRVNVGYEFLRVRCHKGRKRILQEAGA